MVGDLSCDYANGSRVIIELPIVNIDLWRDSSIWLRSAKIIKDDSSTNKFYVASSTLDVGSVEFNQLFVRNLLTRRYRSLKEYSDKRFGKFWTVEIGSNNWQNSSSCDCPVFMKHYKCKHIVGIALKSKLCKLPRQALCITLTQKKKRGRKPKATSALKK